MFTGIIEELGRVKNLKRKGSSAVLSVKSEKISLDAKIGDSISVDGACLTVISNSNEVLEFALSIETLEKTNAGSLKPGDKTNLERALMANSRLGGHFVTGHIDCTTKIKKKEKIADTLKIDFQIRPEFLKYIVSKGSIAIDGISLTIAEVYKNYFSVYIIPYTLTNTTLGFKKENDSVNIEFDILAKYVNKLFPSKKESNLTIDFLESHGFV